MNKLDGKGGTALVLDYEEPEPGLKDIHNVGVAKIQDGIKRKTKKIISKIDGLSNLESEKPAVLKFSRHKVSLENRAVKAIGKWTDYAIEQNDLELLGNLESMTVIADDELELRDGTIVKLGYHKIEADNKEIFEKMVKDIEGNPIKAVYFKNKGAFKKLIDKMKQRGFRLAGNWKDTNGKVAEQEMKRIFDMIAKEGTPNYTTIIIDILGRAFSGCCNNDGKGISLEGHMEYFWTYSLILPIKEGGILQNEGGDTYYLYLGRCNDFTGFSTLSREYGHGALFFKDKPSVLI